VAAFTIASTLIVVISALITSIFRFCFILGPPGRALRWRRTSSPPSAPLARAQGLRIQCFSASAFPDVKKPLLSEGLFLIELHWIRLPALIFLLRPSRPGPSLAADFLSAFRAPGARSGPSNPVPFRM
ncbi:MAG: hypothetical protein AB1404_06145, partial [Spirochaetota bacterium]